MIEMPSKLNLRLRAVAFLALLVGLFYLSAWLLLNPNNVVNRSFRAPISSINSRVVLGPYPIESDFATLRQNGVTTIVSLLDRRVPYEEVLLEREKLAAARFGLKVLNFPMTSLFGQKLGDNYEQNAAAAANAILQSHEKIYLHCYLGVHRTTAVRELLERNRVETGDYLPRPVPTLTTNDNRAERVSMRYDVGDFAGAISWYKSIANPKPSTRLLAAWAYLRLNQIDDAEALFRQVAEQRPDLWDSRNGLAYCALRRGVPGEAEMGFRAVLDAHPGNAQAMIGLAVAKARVGQFGEADTVLGEVLAAHPDNSEAGELQQTYRRQAEAAHLAEAVHARR